MAIWTKVPAAARRREASSVCGTSPANCSRQTTCTRRRSISASASACSIGSSSGGAPSAGSRSKNDPKQPRQVIVCPGYALDPCGGEIHVPQAVNLDLARCIRMEDDPCTPAAPAVAVAAAPATEVFIAIRSVDCLSRPVRTTPLGCGCDETACEYSRIRDGFEVACLTPPGLAQAHGGRHDSLRNEEERPSPAVPTRPELILGRSVFYRMSSAELAVQFCDPRQLTTSSTAGFCGTWRSIGLRQPDRRVDVA